MATGIMAQEGWQIVHTKEINHGSPVIKYMFYLEGAFIFLSF